MTHKHVQKPLASVAFSQNLATKCHVISQGLLHVLFEGLGLIRFDKSDGDVCQGLNFHYFHTIGDGHQPNSRGLYTHYKDSY